ncbi:MAG: (Fe-S)-binding protein [Deltaproteobacteria bacterium]|nr:(Fe-S)-binding protein [Candidatus Anaeroferrophillacea bacterium]
MEADFDAEIAYRCLLCGGCEPVCPKDVKIRDYFFTRRREAVRRELAPLPAHRGLIRYEKMVAAKCFTRRHLPPGCRRVLFPGCGAAGKNPEMVAKLHRFLADRLDESLGLVLDCCLKISHDLGREDYFNKHFGRLTAALETAGVEEVITLCPSCTVVFRQHSRFTVTPAYHYLGRWSGDLATLGGRRFAVHDPCVLRADGDTHDDVRSLLTERGAAIESMKHERRSALCCGEGGGVCHLDPEVPRRLKERRLAETSDPLVVYCYACRDFLANDTVPVHHLLDLLFAVESRTPFWRTWFNRLRLKRLKL